MKLLGTQKKRLKDKEQQELIIAEKTKLENYTNFYCGCGFKTFEKEIYKNHQIEVHNRELLSNSSHFLTPFFNIILPTSRRSIKMQEKNMFESEIVVEELKNELNKCLFIEPQEPNEENESSSEVNLFIKAGTYIEYYECLKLIPNKVYEGRSLYFCGECEKEQPNGELLINHMLEACETTHNIKSSHVVEEIEWREQMSRDYVEFFSYFKKTGKIIEMNDIFIISNDFYEQLPHHYYCAQCNAEEDSAEKYVKCHKECKVHLKSSAFIIDKNQIKALNKIYGKKKEYECGNEIVNIEVYLNNEVNIDNNYNEHFVCGDCENRIETIEEYFEHLQNCGYFEHEENSHFIKTKFIRNNIKIEENLEEKDNEIELKEEEEENINQECEYFCFECKMTLSSKTYSRHFLCQHNEQIPFNSSHVIIRRKHRNNFLLAREGPEFQRPIACVCNLERLLCREEAFLHFSKIHKGFSPILKCIISFK